MAAKMASKLQPPVVCTCGISCPSEVSLKEHMKGAKHLKRLTKQLKKDCAMFAEGVQDEVSQIIRDKGETNLANVMKEYETRHGKKLEFVGKLKSCVEKMPGVRVGRGTSVAWVGVSEPTLGDGAAVDVSLNDIPGVDDDDVPISLRRLVDEHEAALRDALAPSPVVMDGESNEKAVDEDNARMADRFCTTPLPSESMGEDSADNILQSPPKLKGNRPLSNAQGVAAPLIPSQGVAFRKTPGRNPSRRGIAPKADTFDEPTNLVVGAMRQSNEIDPNDDGTDDDGKISIGDGPSVGAGFRRTPGRRKSGQL